MNESPVSLPTTVVDLYTPANRFVSASQIHERLHRWWLLFRKYWWLLVLIPAGILVPVYCYTILSGPTFVSKARMWITGKINVTENWSYTEELVNFLGTQAALLRSPTIQQQAMAKMQAESKPGPEPPKAGGWMEAVFDQVRALRRSWFSSEGAAESNGPPSIPFSVNVQEGSKSSTLELQVIGREPLSTQRFLDCLMDVYLNFKKEAVDKASGQAATSLQAEAAQLKAQLAAAQAELQDFQASNNVVFLQQQGSSAESYLASLNRQLAVLRTELKLLDSLQPEQWAATGTSQPSQASGEETTARHLLSSLAESQTALFQADQKMRLLIARREELARYLRPAHPKIIKLNQEIATQEELVKVSRDEAAKQLALRRQALELQIRNIEGAFSDWNVRAIEASRKMADYGEIQQKVRRLQAAYDKTVAQVQDIEVSKRIEQANVGVLDPASVAKPTHRKFIYLAVAATISLLFCFGVLYVIGLFQDDFASPAELGDLLAAPVVGRIPSSSLHKLKPPLGIEGLERQHFEFLEAFRNLRAWLLCSNNGATKSRTILIASSVPGEGKSTVALYLAATLARAGARTLLIDGDLRRPSLRHYFGLASGPGLAELLNGEVTATEVTCSTALENLALLPAGNAKRNPGDLVVGPAWAQFLAWAKARFSYILIDSPPVAATEDAAALALRADGVLFVVRALSTSARVARGALGALQQRGAQVVGLVFNRAVASPCERPYYQPYANSYRWKPADSSRPAGGELAAPASR